MVSDIVEEEDVQIEQQYDADEFDTEISNKDKIKANLKAAGIFMTEDENK